MKLTSQMPSSTSFDPEFMASQHSGDVDPLAMQAKATTGGDENLAIVARIDQFGQAIVRAWRGQVEVAGAFHAKRLMRSFGIERLPNLQ
jgi:hypothetical protein